MQLEIFGIVLQLLMRSVIIAFHGSEGLSSGGGQLALIIFLFSLGQHQVFAFKSFILDFKFHVFELQMHIFEVKSTRILLQILIILLIQSSQHLFQRASLFQVNLERLLQFSHNKVLGHDFLL